MSSAVSLIAFLVVLDSAEGSPATLDLDSISGEPSGAEAAISNPSLPNPVHGILKPELQLAEVYSEDIDLGRYWVSEKYDGVRAYWDGARLVSRGGHEIHAPEWFVAGFPRVPLDGELWLRRGAFARVSGTVRQLEPDEDAWRQVRFMVFDLPASNLSFGRRLESLHTLLDRMESPYLVEVEQVRLPDRDALMAHLTALVAAGGEGLMLHRDDAVYRSGRSPDLLKLKPYLDAEASVVGHLPGRGKYEGMLGSLLVEDGRGRRFRIGTGFSDAERADPPPLGSCVTFRYRGETSRGLPRFASYLRPCDPE
ncbi:DNA ligase [Imhoffiella purpurea]|nr:DNA ligase [Imhoffiella purpurea]